MVALRLNLWKPAASHHRPHMTHRCRRRFPGASQSCADLPVHLVPGEHSACATAFSNSTRPMMPITVAPQTTGSCATWRASINATTSSRVASSSTKTGSGVIASRTRPARIRRRAGVSSSMPRMSSSQFPGGGPISSSDPMQKIALGNDRLPASPRYRLPADRAGWFPEANARHPATARSGLIVANERRMTSDTFIGLPFEVGFGRRASCRGALHDREKRIALFADLPGVNAMACQIAN